MARTLEYFITETDRDLTVKEYLTRKEFSSRSLIALKKVPGSILLNQKPVFVNQPLQTGDRLTIQVFDETASEKLLPVRLPLEIVYEDEDILVIDKPAGMPIHPSAGNYDNSVANALAWYFKEQDTPFVFRCINRLDKDTSGLTIIAKHFVSAGILSGYLCRRLIHREYLAIVKGTPAPSQGIVNAPISRKAGSILERTVDFEHGETAVTRYELKDTKNGYSLISLYLETGRTHQIRVHMKHIGYPLIGDHLYNPDMERIKRQALHSHRLVFPHPITGQRLEFVSPLPEDMESILHPAACPNQQAPAAQYHLSIH